MIWEKGGCQVFSRFHQLREDREGGFTLIELLVVILIIAILAAIAIPVFLNQRKKGWIAQMESALKNGTTAQESYLVGNNIYADTLAQMQSEGFKFATTVTLGDADITIDSGNKYCIQVSHSILDDDTIEPMAISSEVTTPQKNSICNALGVLAVQP